VWAEPEADPDLLSLLEDYRALSMATSCVAAGGQEAEIGHMKLLFKEGQICPVVTSGGEPMGFSFEGRGRYTYTSEDPVDRQVVEANVMAETDGSIYDDHTLSDRFERLVVFFARPVFKELWEQALADPSGSDTAPASPAAQRGFEKIWKRIGKTYLEYDHLAAEARLNLGRLQYLYVEIEGEKKTVGYSFDRVHAYQERFFIFKKYSDYDLRFELTLSRQLVGGGPAKQPPSVRLIHADIDLSTEDNRVARIDTRLQLEAGRGGLGVIRLALMNNRDYYNYDWSTDRKRLNILKVTDAQGSELPFSHRYHEVLLQLPAPVAKDSTLELNVETEGEILTDWSGERHDRYFELSGDSWFPEPFGWNTGAFTMKLRAKTRKPYLPLSSGKRTKLQEDEEFYILESESDVPVNRIALFAGKYKTHEESFGDITIRNYGYATARKSVLQNMPKLAYAFITFYEQTIGAYPFDELEIVEVPEYGFGVAPSGLVLMTGEAYKPRQDYMAEYFSRGVNSRLAHEVAHQWFGHVAIPASSRDNWIAESLAEYMSGMAMAATAGKKTAVVGFDRMLDEWWRYTLEVREAGPIAAANMHVGSDAGRYRFHLLYSRGPLVMRMLHAVLGNDRFYGILRRFLEQANMDYVTAADFARAASEVLGTDMNWFVKNWFEEAGIPEIKIDYEVQRAEGGGQVLVGTARFEEGQPFKRLIIPIVVEYSGGQPQIVALDLDRPTKSFRQELRGKPKKIKVDPARNCVAKLN
jgi:hypothetical protein